MYNQVPYQQPQRHRKKSGKATIIMFLLCIVVIGVLVFMVINSSKEVKKVEEKEKGASQNQQTTKVRILTDTMKEKMNKKIGMVLGDENFIENGRTNTSKFRTYALKRKLTEEEKQLIAIESTEFESMTIDYQKLEEVKAYIDADSTSKEEFKQQTKEEVNKTYKYIFGDDLGTITKEEFGTCPKVRYYSQEKTFISFPKKCNDTSVSQFIVYVYEYKREGNESYALMSIGYQIDNVIYNDFELLNSESSDSTIISRSPVQVTEYNEDGQPTINEKNYKDFSRYKVSFTKEENEEFYFDNIKQIN